VNLNRAFEHRQEASCDDDPDGDGGSEIAASCGTNCGRHSSFLRL